MIDLSRGRARSAAFLWGLFLFTLTSWPRPPRIPVVSAIPNADKLTHLVLYGVEAFLIYRAVRWPGRPAFSLARVLAITGVLAVWGVADEIHQYWIPGRTMEGGDVAADAAGAALGGLVASAVSAGARLEGADPSSAAEASEDESLRSG